MRCSCEFEQAAIAARDPNIAAVMSRAGAAGSTLSNNRGFMLLTLKPRAHRPEKDIDKIVQNLRRAMNSVAGIRVFVINPPVIRVGGQLTNAAYQFTLQDVDLDTLREQDPDKLTPPLHGALLKNEQDVALFERLAFLSRRQSGPRGPAG